MVSYPDPKWRSSDSHGADDFAVEMTREYSPSGYRIEANYMCLNGITDSQGKIGRKIPLKPGCLLSWYFFSSLGSYQLIAGVTALSKVLSFFVAWTVQDTHDSVLGKYKIHRAEI